MPGEALLQQLEAHHATGNTPFLLGSQGIGAGEGRALVELHDPAEPGLEWGDGIVDLIAVQRVRHLQPQRIACTQPDRHRAGGGDRVPQFLGGSPAAVQLEAIFARIPGARDEAVHSTDAAGAELVVADALEIEARQRLQRRLRGRALHRQQADVIRYIAQANICARLLVHDVVPGPFPVGRIDHQHHLVLEAIDRAVVDEGAFGGEDRRVLHLARPERADVVAGHPVDERIAVGAGDFELAHVRHIEHAHALPHRIVLGGDPGGVLHRHLVAGEGNHLRPEGDVRVMQRCVFHECPIKVAMTAFCT